MSNAYERAAQILDVKNLSPSRVAMVSDFIRQYAPDGSVYAMYHASTLLVKIGRSEHVPRRLSALGRQWGMPLSLLASAYCPCAVAAVERWLHRHFHDMRVSGEWFACNPALFADSRMFHNLVQDAHYEILRKTWHDLIVHKLLGSWVLDKEKVRRFISG